VSEIYALRVAHGAGEAIRKDDEHARVGLVDV